VTPGNINRQEFTQKASTPTLKKSSTQGPSRSSARHTKLILQQNRNTTLNIKRWDAQKPCQTHKLNTGQFIALQRDPDPPTRTQTQVLQPGNLDKPLVQPHPQGADSTIKKNHELPTCRKGTAETEIKTKWKGREYSAGEGTWKKNPPNQRVGDK